MEAILVMAADRTPVASGIDLAGDYLQHVLAMIRIRDVTVIDAGTPAKGAFERVSKQIGALFMDTPRIAARTAIGTRTLRQEREDGTVD